MLRDNILELIGNMLPFGRQEKDILDKADLCNSEAA